MSGYYNSNLFYWGPYFNKTNNWFAHKVGYRSFDVTDTSTNLMPFDLITMGEGYHNNHHAHSGNANFSQKWYETDLSYPVIALLDAIGVIKLVKTK